MLELTAEQFAQRAYDLDLVDQRDLELVWSHFGTRDISTNDLQNELMHREFLTNYQVERLLKGEKAGFFYGDYKVLYLVGTGSFARVYRAVHSQTRRVYALKVLRKRHSEKPPETKKFLREGEMGMKLIHPNIVPIHEVHSIRRVHFLVMDFIEGQSLREFVKIRRRVEAPEAVEILQGVVRGLAYAAEKGITHRDLKLSNVLISSEGQPMLVDFGLAAVEGNEGNARTIDYAGLEKLTNVPKGDTRSDIFFTGTMLYHLLTGRHALPPGKSTDRFREIISIRQLCPDLPTAVESVVNRAMQMDVHQRYQTQLELMVDLRKAAKVMDPDTSGSPEANAAAPEDMKRVLVVESNDGLQNSLRTGLKKSGFRALLIEDATRAWQRLSRDAKTADTVIISLASLGKAGLVLHQQLLEHEATARLPQILLFGKSQGKFQSQLELPEHVIPLTMPLKMVDVRQTLKQLLGTAQPASDG